MAHLPFFCHLKKEFKVDISGFTISKYFNAEGFDPIGINKFLGFIVGKENIPNPEIRKSVNLGHLIHAINEGRLDDFSING